MEEITKNIYILYGSATGNGESIAHILEQILIEDLQKDVSITISKGLDLFQKVMNKK